MIRRWLQRLKFNRSMRKELKDVVENSYRIISFHGREKK